MLANNVGKLSLEFKTKTFLVYTCCNDLKFKYKLCVKLPNELNWELGLARQLGNVNYYLTKKTSFIYKKVCPLRCTTQNL
jgi:hypothetical protein